MNPWSQDLRVAFLSLLLAVLFTAISYAGIDFATLTPVNNLGTVSLLSNRNATGGAVTVKSAYRDGPPRPLIHVFNPYVNEHSSPNFEPLGMTQWIMMASMHDAKRYYNAKAEAGTLDLSGRPTFDVVMTVCPVFHHDIEKLSDILAHYCDHVRVLRRSTASEYPNIHRAIPFLKDIIEAARSVVEIGNGYNYYNMEYYVMYTNADISADEDLFVFAERELRGGVQFLNILRRTIAPENVPLLASLNELDLGGMAIKHQAVMRALSQSRSALRGSLSTQHPGHDCLTIRSDVLRRIDFGDIFIAMPPWSGVMNNWVVNVMSDRRKIVKPTMFGTFHIGDERSWVPKNIDPYLLGAAINRYNVTELKNILYCPPASRIMPYDDCTIQQYINCGKLVKPKSKTNLAASYVMPGYEDLFHQKKGNRFSGNQKDKYIQWFQKYGDINLGE